MIPLYRLVRVIKSNLGTGGVLLNHDMVPICNTVEREWKGNEVDVSCIPTGLYMAHRHMRHNGHEDEYEVFMLENVPGRTVIQIHIANFPSQLKGCIAPVDKWWPEKGVAGAYSSNAFNDFMDELKDINRIALLITESAVQTRDISAAITNLERKE